VHRASLTLALATCFVLAGCPMPPTASQRLSEASYDFNTAARFGRMDIASELVREIARDEFGRKHAQWGKSIRVVDMELNGMSMRKDGDADVTITVSWQRADETSMRTTDITQRWTSTKGSWALLSEAEKSGDHGLIGEPEAAKEDAPPPVAAPTRSRYQTRVIYEQ
jgi:hypothetical protein